LPAIRLAATILPASNVKSRVAIFVSSGMVIHYPSGFSSADIFPEDLAQEGVYP
jgi:hypothetical protein